MKKFVLFFLLIPIYTFSQHQLSVNVNGVKKSEGNISIAVYDTSEGFLKFDKVYMSDSTTAEKGTTQLTLNLPEGEYALAVFHDKNANDELDTNFMGIPKEPVGFSKSKMKMFGPPCFKECAFKVITDSEISIVL